MSSELTPALLAGAFALAGTLVAGILGLVGYVLKTRQDFRGLLLSRQFDRRQQVYEQAFDIAAALYQTGSKQPSLEDIRMVNRGLILVGSTPVLRAWNRIATTSAEKLRTGGASGQEILDIQTAVAREFFQAIRMDLFPRQHRLDADDIRFIEPKGNSIS